MLSFTYGCWNFTSSYGFKVRRAAVTLKRVVTKTVGEEGIEPSTFGLNARRSFSELLPHVVVVHLH